MRTRESVHNLTNDTLYWYSEAIKILKARNIDDPTSWWYMAAVHGYNGSSPYWKQATGYPPSQATQSSGYWNRCQHATWYFLPWHRMYLNFFERTVAEAVVQAGGPQDWALPYWNYCNYFESSLSQSDKDAALEMPQEFGSPVGRNSRYPELWLPGRAHYRLQPQNVDPQSAMRELEFTNDFSIQFGGGITGFAHFGGHPGQLESLPHNIVHVDIGGAMGDPDEAALDPIFWLHHANIDRLWYCWLKQPGRKNPTDSQWLDFSFKFHDISGNITQMKVSETLNTQQLGYKYTSEYPEAAATAVSFGSRGGLASQPPGSLFNALDVIGASSVLDKNASTPFAIEMVPEPNRNVNFAAISDRAMPQKRTLIKLSNVRGKGKLPPMDVVVFVGADDEQGVVAGSVGLFGLEQASTPSIEHDGSGLNLMLDATATFDELRRKPGWDENQIFVELKPQEDIDESSLPEIGRISVHSEIDN